MLFHAIYGFNLQFTLQPSEYITSVKGHMGSFFGYLCGRSLKFETNFGCYGPYGKEEGTAFELPAINGQIIGFHAQSGPFVDALGVYVQVCKVTNFFFFFF